jgi:hypothetical protein
MSHKSYTEYKNKCIVDIKLYIYISKCGQKENKNIKKST